MVRYKEFTFHCTHCGCGFKIELDPEDLIKFQSGLFPIDSIMNYLNRDEKDMIYSKTCQTCWRNLFGEEDNE